MADANIIGQISDQLGRIFRHMMPGLSVLCAAGASHPSWFTNKFSGTPWNLAMFAAIAVLAGNTWYVFHRYSVHQLIDWLVYWKQKRNEGGYIRWLANHVYKSFHFKSEDQRLHDHITFRSAQVIFIFITSEVTLLFSWHAEPGTFYLRHTCAIRIVALLGIAVGLFQYVISNNLDVLIVERCVHGKSS